MLPPSNELVTTISNTKCDVIWGFMKYLGKKSESLLFVYHVPHIISDEITDKAEGVSMTNDDKIGPMLEKIGPMLPIRDVAKLLHVHVNTVRRWSDQGILKSYRITRRGDRRFKREDIAYFLAQFNEFNAVKKSEWRLNQPIEKVWVR
jgi:excisionase family DNA binding protein